MAEQLYLSSLIRVLTNIKDQLGDLPITSGEELFTTDELEIKAPIQPVEGPAPDGLGTYLERVDVNPHLNIRTRYDQY